jgi:hypothetical protein
MVKVLTTAAAIAAITSGSITVYASQGYDYIRIGGPGGTEIRIEALADNQAYRQSIIAAFNTAQPLHLRNEDDSRWTDASSLSSADGIFTPPQDDSNYLPYDI